MSGIKKTSFSNECQRTLVRLSAYALAVLCVIPGAHGAALSPFTVAVGVRLAHFQTFANGVCEKVGMTSAPTRVIFSPNGKFAAVCVQRGLLARNRVEDELRIYSVAAIRQFIRQPRHRHLPKPVVDLREATFKEGPTVKDLHWLPNSKGVAFLLRSATGSYRLEIMRLEWRNPRTVSLKTQDVTWFALHDQTHYVYGVAAPLPSFRVPPKESGAKVGDKVSWDATGYSLPRLLIPRQLRSAKSTISSHPIQKSYLWAAFGGTPRVVKSKSGQRVAFYPQYAEGALSPDGEMLAIALPVKTVPVAWRRDYRAPIHDDPYDFIHAGRQHRGTRAIGAFSVEQYALIKLRTGSVVPVNGTPIGADAGWYVTGRIKWSRSGAAILLPGAFLRPEEPGNVAGKPCIAAFYWKSNTLECVQGLKSSLTADGSLARGFALVKAMRFDDKSGFKVIIRWSGRPTAAGRPGREWTTVLVNEKRVKTWRVERHPGVSKTVNRSVALYVRQNLNEPPELVGTVRGMRHAAVIWNPNGQLSGVSLGKVSVYHWRDAAGRKWAGGLYWPTNYMSGRRYPLVIQTHGFHPHRFSASGIFPTAFAARALAASGMFVLQSPLCVTVVETPKSAACARGEYDAAVNELASQGLVDRRRVGIIGFSYTVYTVIAALTTGDIRFAAASVTDGLNFGYWEEMADVDLAGNVYTGVTNAVVGAKPFGTGLRVWMAHSPEFNMENVHTPLLVNALNRGALLEMMWEPYALLRALNKPVELTLFRHDYEHILTEPEMRLGSESQSVYWFRFWLEGYESSRPSMRGEYRRWEHLCVMQRAEEHGGRVFCASTPR